MNDDTEKNKGVKVDEKLLNEWAMDTKSDVAIHLRQRLFSVEADGSGYQIVFPPTYANIGYNIDKLSNGESVVVIDSVGSQANRIEPLFKTNNKLKSLVPQLKVTIDDDTKISIFDIAHRAADATVQATPDLAKMVNSAFKKLQNGDAEPLCSIAPTSLVFGVWDSRGETKEKRPRLLKSIVRGWNVEALHGAAQFNSLWKKLDENLRNELEKEAKAKGKKLSDSGLKDAPSVFRKDAKVDKYLNGAPNPEARVLGGVLIKGKIERELTINLIALRSLHGGDDSKTKNIRQYLLGLSLMAATADLDFFLREGCNLRLGDEEDIWYAVPRRGEPRRIDLASAHSLIEKYTKDALEHFRSNWPKDESYQFDVKEAKKLIGKKAEEKSEDTDEANSG